MKTQFKRLLMLSLCLLCFGISSYSQGIKWAEGLSWEQIKAKAKAENKYIFVDCYATWCGPCKQMDREVYPLAMVGNAVNDKFISVKVQMDSTKGDPENVKQYYTTAKELAKKYSVIGFPTYLFLSAEGEIVHKAMGFQDSTAFIKLINDVQTSEKQLYSQIKAYREGKMEMNLVPAFIQRLKDNGNKAVAVELAKKYMKDYLEKLPEAKFVMKGNLNFMWDYQKMLLTNDRIYELCFQKPKMLDSIYGAAGYSDLMVTNILLYDYVLPAIDKGKKTKNEPNWKDIHAVLVRRSDNKRAEQILIDSKHYWYCVIEDWDKACDFEIIKFQRKDLKKLNPDQVAFELNKIAWTLFEYSFSKKQLEQGLVWINEALTLDKSNNKPDPNRMDTKANILYKLGRKDEAIALQTTAVSLAPKYADLNAALDKMKLDQPTWEIGVKDMRKVK